MPAQKKYDEETQARAVRMYADRMTEGDISQRSARTEVGELLGIKEATLRNWVRRDLGEGSTPAFGENDDEDNSERLHSSIADVPPAEYEQIHYDSTRGHDKHVAA